MASRSSGQVQERLALGECCRTPSVDVFGAAWALGQWATWHRARWPVGHGEGVRCGVRTGTRRVGRVRRGRRQDGHEEQLRGVCVQALGRAKHGARWLVAGIGPECGYGGRSGTQTRRFLIRRSAMMVGAGGAVVSGPEVRNGV